MARADVNLFLPGASTTAEAIAAKKPFIGFAGGNLPPWLDPSKPGNMLEHTVYAREFGIPTEFAVIPDRGRSVTKAAGQLRSKLESVLVEANRAKIRLPSTADFDVGRKLINIIETAEQRGTLGVAKKTGWLTMRRYKTLGAGAGIALGIHSLFSGRDDAYNTIEGMSESGLAAQMRKENTDFGSGLLATVAKNSSKGWQQLTQQEVLREASKYLRNEGFEIVGGRGHKFFKMLSQSGYSSDDIFQQLMYRGGKPGASMQHPNAVWRPLEGSIPDPSDAELAAYFELEKYVKSKRGFIFVDMGATHTKPGLPPRAQKYLDQVTNRGSLFHEMSEAHYSLMQDRGIVTGRISTHNSMGVVADELMLAALGVPGTYAAARADRLKEKWNLALKSPAHPVNEEMLKPWGKYWSRGSRTPFLYEYPYKTLKMIGTLDKKLGQQFGWSEHIMEQLEKAGQMQAIREAGTLEAAASAMSRATGARVIAHQYGGKQTYQSYKPVPQENKAANAISGLPEGGESQRILSALTPWGSSLDRMKVIARLMGQEFDEVLASKAFHQALAGGTFERPLGQGAFGRVDLMKTMFGGEDLFYVRKTIRERSKIDKWVMDQVDAGADISSAMAAARQNTDLALEARRMQEAGELIDIVPTSYTHNEAVSYMEYMEGDTLKEAIKAGRDMAKPLQQMQDAIQKLAAGRMVNLDINMKNVIWNEKVQRAAWIDWGYADDLKGMAGMLKYQSPAHAERMMDNVFRGFLVSEKNAAQRALSAGSTTAVAEAGTPLIGQSAIQDVTRTVPPPVMRSTRESQARKLMQAEAQKNTTAQMFRNARDGGKRHDTAYARRIARAQDPFNQD
jgi:hypothetical protein